MLSECVCVCVFLCYVCVHVTGARVQLIRAYVHGRSAAAVRAVLRGAGHGRVLSPVLHRRSSQLQTRRSAPIATAVLLSENSSPSKSVTFVLRFMSL